MFCVVWGSFVSFCVVVFCLMLCWYVFFVYLFGLNVGGLFWFVLVCLTFVCFVVLSCGACWCLLVLLCVVLVWYGVFRVVVCYVALVCVGLLCTVLVWFALCWCVLSCVVGFAVCCVGACLWCCKVFTCLGVASLSVRMLWFVLHGCYHWFVVCVFL